jgi:hypothetical protein
MNSTRTRTPVLAPIPWSRGDVYHLARSYGFPALRYPGLERGGESAWKAVLATAGSALCERLRAALPSDAATPQRAPAKPDGAAARTLSPPRMDDLRWWQSSFVTPSGREADLTRRVAAWLHTHATRLPTFRLFWFSPSSSLDQDIQRDVLGRTLVEHAPPIPVMLRSGLGDAQLVETLVHETQHVLDAPAALGGMSTAELEQRAETAAARWTPTILRRLGIAPQVAAPSPLPVIHPFRRYDVVYRPTPGLHWR